MGTADVMGVNVQVKVGGRMLIYTYICGVRASVWNLRDENESASRDEEGCAVLLHICEVLWWWVMATA